MQQEGLYQPLPFSHRQKPEWLQTCLRRGVFCVMVTSSGESCAERSQHISCNDNEPSPMPKKPGDILTSSATITARCGPWAYHRRDRLPTPTDAALFC